MTSTHNAVACTECGASDAIQIELKLPDGTEVEFCSCHRCENRWWNQGGKLVDVAQLLQMARRTAD
jgi:DNA-directed RNA polymerase subunit M/transcription elongation factor TFIIS